MPLLTLQPLIVNGKAVERHEFAMFEDLRKRYHWVLPTFRYQDTADLLASLQERSTRTQSIVFSYGLCSLPVLIGAEIRPFL
jgi:hypothetical protein